MNDSLDMWVHERVHSGGYGDCVHSYDIARIFHCNILVGQSRWRKTLELSLVGLIRIPSLALGTVMSYRSLQLCQKPALVVFPLTGFGIVSIGDVNREWEGSNTGYGSWRFSGRGGILNKDVGGRPQKEFMTDVVYSWIGDHCGLRVPISSSEIAAYNLAMPSMYRRF